MIQPPQFQQPSYTYYAIVQHIVDGDTIDVELDIGFGIFLAKRLRLLGIDTWELHEERGPAAKQRMQQLVEQSNNELYVMTQKDETGKYGRVLAWLWTKDDNGNVGNNINETLLSEGHGVEIDY